MALPECLLLPQGEQEQFSGSGIIGGDGTPGENIYSINIGDAVQSATTTLSNSALIDGNISVYTGSTFNINADLTIMGGAITTTTTGIVGYTSGTPTVILGAATGTIGGGSGAITFYNLTLADGGYTTTAASDFTVNHQLYVNGTTAARTLNGGSRTITLAGSGTGTSRPLYLYGNGTFTSATSTVRYTVLQQLTLLLLFIII
jgi:hypothetical protein